MEDGPHDILLVRRESVGVLRTRDTNDISHLPPHPSHSHVDRRGVPSSVLPRCVADLVLQPLEIPADADDKFVYAATGRDTKGAVLLRAVWFTAHHGDAVGEYEAGSLLMSAERIATVVRRECVCVPVRSGDGVQHAAGAYVEVGVGILPGGCRSSISTPDWSGTVPFSRNGTLSDEVEPDLQAVMHVAARLMHISFPGVVPIANKTPLRSAYQYPSAVPGQPFIPSHQVALRSESIMGSSDLHTDACDGGGELGAVALYYCPIHAVVTNPSIAVFEGCRGGRGIRVKVFQPGWFCAVAFRTDQCLHGTVCEFDTRSIESTGPSIRSESTLRIITYPLKRVEELLRAELANPEVVYTIASASDQRLCARMHLSEQSSAHGSECSSERGVR